MDEAEAIFLCASAERGSEHPIARAIVAGAQDRDITLAEPEAFQAVPGRGIDATVRGRRLLAGNIQLMQENGIDTAAAAQDAKALSDAGRTLMYIAAAGALAALMAAADTVKPSSKALWARCGRLGIDVYMITGDNQSTAAGHRQGSDDRPCAGRRAAGRQGG